MSLELGLGAACFRAMLVVQEEDLLSSGGSVRRAVVAGVAMALGGVWVFANARQGRMDCPQALVYRPERLNVRVRVVSSGCSS